MLRAAVSVVVASLCAFAPPALASTLTVTSSADGGSGSLRAALVTASSGDTIVFDPSVTAIALSSELIITTSVTIQGPGAIGLQISNASGRILHLDTSPKTVLVSGLSLLNGNVSGKGGGILNDGGNLHLSSVVISGNHASDTGGAIYNNYNGSGNELTIDNSEISNNSANKSAAIDFIGYQLVINNSTIAGNAATDSAGAINLAFATASINNSTIAGNHANFVGGINSQSSTLNFSNTILANNTDGSGTNDLNRTGGGTSYVNATSSLFSEAFVVADNVINGVNTNNLVGVNPMLGPLQNNGGATRTLLPGTSSPAIDAGDDAACSATPISGSDQRGVSRWQGPHCDIGATEFRQDFLHVIATVGGKVTAGASPAPLNGGIDCANTDCSAYYAAEQTPPPISLTATAGSGYFFIGWSGNCAIASSTSAITSVTLQWASECIAMFVNTATTTTIAQVTPSPSSVGGSVSVQVGVTRDADSVAASTGTVTVQNLTDGTSCSFALSATPANNFCTLATNIASTKTLAASFTPADQSFADSQCPTASATSPCATLQVDPATSSTTLGASWSTAPATPLYGENITFTAIVATANSAPTGTIAFADGGTPLPGCAAATIALVSGHWQAQCSTSSLTVGSHSLVATFTSGDGNTTNSASPVLTQMVDAAPSGTTLSSSINPSLVGQNVTFTATVTPQAGNPEPTGAIVFDDGGTTLCTATLSGGQAFCMTANLTTGSHAINASYSGDVFTAASNTTLVQTVDPVSSHVALTSSSNPSQQGAPITFTATVSIDTANNPAVNTKPTAPSSADGGRLAPSAATLAGSVTFADGAAALGTSALVNGVTTLTTSFAAPGSHNITATFASSDPSVAGSSASITQIVNTAPAVPVVSAPALSAWLGGLLSALLAAVALARLRRRT